MVVVDTLRADHLQVYGYERPTSPRLRERSPDWFVFENAQSPAPWTAPALISLITSLHPVAHGVLEFPNPGRLAERVDTLPEILKRAGFATAAFTEGGYAKADFGLGQGFDHFPRSRGDDESHESNVLYPSRLEANLDRALAWLAARRDERFFLLFHTYETHTPYRAPEPYVRALAPDWDEAAEHARLREAILRWNRTRQLTPEELLALQIHLSHCRLAGLPEPVDRPALAQSARAAGLGGADLFRSAPFRRRLTDLYDAEIAYTDAQLERLWGALDAPALRDQTLVVLLSDHGEGFGEHGHFDHGSVLHEELLRIPLMLRVPGSHAPPRRIPDLVRAIDLTPTLLDLLGVEVESPHFQGRSLVGLLRGEDLAPLPSFSHARSAPSGPADTLTSIRDARFRLLLDAATGRARLFDLEADPAETRDVADRQPEAAARLRADLEHQNARDRALHAAAAETGAPPGLSREAREELRALGYLDD